MSRPRRRLSKPISLRLPLETIEALESISEEVGVKVTDIIKIFIAEGLNKQSKNEKLSTYTRLRIIDARIEDLKREEERVRRTWKQFLRSHPKAYLLKNIDLDYYHGDRRKIERLNRLIEFPKLKEAIEVLINRQAYITKEMENLLIEQKRLLQELYEDYKPIKEYIEEAEKKIETGPQYD